MAGGAWEHGWVGLEAEHDDQEGWQEARVDPMGQHQVLGTAKEVSAVLATGIMVRQAKLIQVPWAAVLAQLHAWTTMPTLPPPSGALTPTTSELEGVWAQCLNDAQFVAGVPNTRHTAWRQFFQWVNAGGALHQRTGASAIVVGTRGNH